LALPVAEEGGGLVVEGFESGSVVGFDLLGRAWRGRSFGGEIAIEE